MSPNQPQRQRFLKDYLTELAREYAHSQGLGYLSWERSVATGEKGQVTYSAIGSDGEKPVKLPFTAALQKRMELVEEWVRTGEGLQPVLPSQSDDAEPVPTKAKPKGHSIRV